MKDIKVLLAGEGGQGIQTIAKALAEVAVDDGYQCSYIPSFGVEQRGTPSIAFITISRREIHYPRFDIADYCIILQKRAIQAVSSYISPTTKVIFDSSVISPNDLPKQAVILQGIPATKFAFQKFTPRAFNVLVLGKLSKVLNLPEEGTWKMIMKILGKKFKTKEVEEKNHEAFIFGRNSIFEVSDFTEPTYVPQEQALLYRGHGKKGQIVPARCKGCGICIAKCPVGALRFGDELGVYASPIPTIDLEKCIACGNCFKFCPDAAIEVEKEES